MQKNQEEILRDIKKSGKKFDWQGWKLKSSQLSYIFSELNEFNKSVRVACCGEFLKFVKAQNCEWECLKLVEAHFCKHKLCPLCNKRRSDKHSIQVKQILDKARINKAKARYLLLTLTAKNAIDGNSLNSALTDMSRAFNKLIKRKKIQKNFIGGMRVTEVTVSKIDGSYNQHMHILFMVSSNYFNGSENYLCQAEWTQMWKESLQVEYNPIVHIEVVKPHKTKAKNEKDLMGAVYEVSKYPVKDSDYLTDDEEENKRRVNDLDIGLFRKRQIAYLGLFKDIKKQLCLQDVEDDDADLVGEDVVNTDEISNYIVYRWDKHRQNYYKF
ncbi:MAG: protein rep [Bacteroidetes bacterium]|nr:protein rep [Bacteroidota bacterium]